MRVFRQKVRTMIGRTKMVRTKMGDEEGGQKPNKVIFTSILKHIYA